MNDLTKTLPQSIPLGRKSPYPTQYDKGLLQKIVRANQRAAMNIEKGILNYGGDIWNAYELCWLNKNGKPIRAVASIEFKANSPYLIESKSLKLYLNSLNSVKFAKKADVLHIIEKDLSEITESQVSVRLFDTHLSSLDEGYQDFYCLDELDVSIEKYTYTPHFLKHDESGKKGADKIVSHTFKSHCLCTGQPDWGSIFISYEGKLIDRKSILKYLISFHNHKGFSENCIEQIYTDIMRRLKPEKLLVFGRFTRRGGIDINPYRANYDAQIKNCRLLFQ